MGMKISNDYKKTVERAIQIMDTIVDSVKSNHQIDSLERKESQFNRQLASANEALNATREKISSMQ